MGRRCMEDPFAKSSRGGSKLDALVAQDQQWQNQGNTSLAYKPLSRSEIKRRAEAEAASARALQSPQASASPSASAPQANNNLKLAVPGNLIRYDSGNPVALGPKGLALLNLAPGQYTLLIYDLQTQKQEVVVMLSDAFELLVQPNNYCSFWDATPTLWAIQFASAEVQQALVAHIALAKYHYAIVTNQNKCIVSNMAPVSDSVRTLAVGDAVKVSYALHLVENTQLCAAPTTDLTAILGQAVESISPDEKLKSLYLGSLKKDIPLFDCLIGGVKNVSRIIVAPSGMAYGNKETVKVPQGSAVVVIATVHKVKPGDGKSDETAGGSEGKKREKRERVRGDGDQSTSLPTIPSADDNDDNNDDILTPLKSTGTRTRTDPSTSTPTSTSASGEPTVVVSDIDSEDEEAQRRRRLASRMGRLSMAQRGATLPTAAPLLPETVPVRGVAEDADVTATTATPNTATDTNASTNTTVATPAVAVGAEAQEAPVAVTVAAVPVVEEMNTPAPTTTTTTATAATPATPPVVSAMAAADMPLSPAPSYQHTNNAHLSTVPVHNQTGMGSPVYYSTGSSPNLSTGSAGNYGTGYQFIQQQALLEQLANRVESMYLQLTGGLFKGDAVNGLQFLQIAQKLVQERDGAVGEVEGKDRKIGELMSKVEEMRAKYELVLEETTAKTKARYDSFQQDNQLYQEQVLGLQNDKRELMIKNNENLLKVSELEMQLEMMQQQMDVKARVIAGEKLIEVKMELSSITDTLNEVKAQLAGKVEEVAREREAKEKAEASHTAVLATLEEMKEEMKRKEEEVAAKLAEYTAMEARVRELEEAVVAKDKALEEQQTTVISLQEQVETKDKLLANAAATAAATAAAASVDAEALRAARDEGKQEGVSETLAAAREKIESLTSRSKDRIAQLEAEVAAAQEEVEEVKIAASEKMSKYKEAVLAARADLVESERVREEREREVQELKIAVEEAKATATQAVNNTTIPTSTSSATTATATATALASGATAGVGAGAETVTEEVITEKTSVKVPVSLPVGVAAVTLLQSVYGETAALLEDFDGAVDGGIALKALKKAVKSVLGGSDEVKVEGEVDAEVEKVCVVRTVTVKVVEEREREIVVEKVVEKVVEVPVEVVREVIVERVVEVQVEAKHDATNTNTDANTDANTTPDTAAPAEDAASAVGATDAVDVVEVDIVAEVISEVVTEAAVDGVAVDAATAPMDAAAEDAVVVETAATEATEVAAAAEVVVAGVEAVEAGIEVVAAAVTVDAVTVHNDIEPVVEVEVVAETADAAAEVEKEEDMDASTKGKNKGKKGKKGKTNKNTKTPAKPADKSDKHDVKKDESVAVAVVTAPVPEEVGPVTTTTTTPTTATAALVEDTEDADVEEAPMTVVFHDQDAAVDTTTVATTVDAAAADVVVVDNGEEAVDVAVEETTAIPAADKQSEANADLPVSPTAATQSSKTLSLFADNFGDDDDLFLPTTTPIAQPTPTVSTSNNMGRAGLFDDENEDDVFMAPVMKAQTSNFSGNLFEDNDDLFG